MEKILHVLELGGSHLSTLSSFLVYYMSLLDVPTSVAVKYEKSCVTSYGMITRIIGLNWIQLNGLPFVDARSKEGIQALISKWLWRYVFETDALWRNVIRKKHGSSICYLHTKIPKGSFGKSIWKGMMLYQGFFFSNITFKVFF